MPNSSTQKASGCGCGIVPLWLILLILGGGYWWLIPQGNFNRWVGQGQAVANAKVQELRSALPEPIAGLIPTPTPSPISAPTPSSANPGVPAVKPTTVLAPEFPMGLPSTVATPSAPTPVASPIDNATSAPIVPATPEKIASPIVSGSSNAAWNKKVIRGIYLSRFQVTNNASEQMIRQRVRDYKAKGFNTIIQGVWGNGCTMYNSIIMQQTLGFKSCPNLFEDQWLDWMIDEAHHQGMQVHAYFEKGIKIDKNSPVFQLAQSRKWLVPGIDKTYPAVDHYVLDVEIPEVANLFRQISSEFVRKYPKIDAVQWDDYLGYYAQLAGKTDRTASLTQFVLQMRNDIKKVNPAVSFDVCHHNPYWAKRYFAADWQNWKVDRAFIQVYNDKNFQDELGYVEQYAGVAIAETQLHRIDALVKNPKIKSILIFPTKGNPEEAARLAAETVGAMK
jgi:Glycosyl hydrolase-like 10